VHARDPFVPQAEPRRHLAFWDHRHLLEQRVGRLGDTGADGGRQTAAEGRGEQGVAGRSG
jgi:hypothetical protein